MVVLMKNRNGQGAGTRQLFFFKWQLNPELVFHLLILVLILYILHRSIGVTRKVIRVFPPT